MSNTRRGQSLAHPTKKSTLALAVNAMLALIIGLQLWLLTATLNTALGGDRSIVIPSMIGSGALFLVAIVLFRLLPKPYAWRSVPDSRIEVGSKPRKPGP